jgi:hypothetical protein
MFAEKQVPEISFNPELSAAERARIKVVLVAHGSDQETCVENFLRGALHSLLNQTTDGRMVWFPVRLNMRGEEPEKLRWHYELAEKQLATKGASV